MEQDKLLKIPQRIDSSNADEFDKIVSDVLSTLSACNAAFVLDASDTEYISSAGLRIILKAAKQTSITIENVSNEVYDILNITGFTEIAKVYKKMREVSVDSLEVIGAGLRGTVYRLDHDTIIKVYNPEVPLSKIRKENEIARKVFLLGIPTAVSYDIVKCKDRYGVVFELLDSGSLTDSIKNEPDKLEEYAERYAGLIKLLHETKADISRLENINDSYKSRVEKLKAHLTAEEFAKLRAVIDNIPDKKVLIHRDPHLENILVRDDELYIIDMESLGCGHPVFDLLRIYQCLYELPAGVISHPEVVPILKQNKVIREDYDPKPLLKMWDIFMKTYFDKDTAEELENHKKQIATFSMMLSLFIVSYNQNPGSKEFAESTFQTCRKPFFEAVDRGEGILTF